MAGDQLSHDNCKKLADLNIWLVNQELGKAAQGLEDTISSRKEADERRRLAEERLLLRQQRQEVLQARKRQEVSACIRIQRAWRIMRNYRINVAPLMSTLRRKMLVDERKRLRDSLNDLRCNVHDLHTLPEDQQRAAKKLQRWWRSELRYRVQAIMDMFDEVGEVRNLMILAATRIQAVYRAKKAGQITDCLRDAKRRQELAADRLFQELKLKSVIAIQSAYRKKRAVKEVQGRRAMMFAAVLSHDTGVELKLVDGGHRSDRKALQDFLTGNGQGGSRSQKGGAAAKGSPRRKRPMTDAKKFRSGD